jgi:UDP-N-acetylmuramoyl-tripeptide--D-alanyl-D-alanine ligase
MEPFGLDYLLRSVDGQLLSGGGTAPVQRVCTDSRHAQPGDVFFALSGERFDGHQFIEEVARKSVAAIVAQGDRIPPVSLKPAMIAVADTRKALGQLGAAYRKQFSVPIIGVAGSNGKTTTKELIASVLRQKLAVLWSEGSFNNEIGVPLTVLNLNQSHQVGVLEVGTNHPGELAPLINIIQPEYGVITNIGREHLEFFGDLSGVAREEGWLAELLPARGKLFINGDSEWTSGIVRRSRGSVVRVGAGEENVWRLLSIRPDKEGVVFRVASSHSEFAGDYRINLLGRHQALNALFAIALGVELGLNRDEISRGLEDCKPAKMRMQFWELGGVRVLDDAYNANADSMLAALQTLQEFPCKGRRVAVLGDMAELGTHSEAAHEEVGRRAAELGVGQLFAIGKMAPIMARGARDAGLNRVFEFTDVESAAAVVKSFLRDGDLLLLKASRSTRLERIADKLRGSEFAARQKN